MRELQVDAFAGGIGRDQDLHFRIVLEGLLCLHSILPPYSAVNGDHG